MISLTIGWVGVISYFVRFPEEGNAVLAGAIVAIWTAAWFAGRAQYARVVGMEAKHQGDLARAALAAQQARAELDTERSRIARDLHDIIGHAVNVMVIHAGAGKGMNDADSDTRATFETIATTGRAALADLDRMLGLLEGGPERAPLPGIAQLADLGASISGEALSVQVTVDGDPGAVSPGVGVAVYRVAQEALTNVLRHAGASRAQVTVVIADEVTLTVTDDGRGGPHRPGRGLTGIGERVAMHGGSVRFGQGPRGGFEVWCRLPLGSTG
ncbi:MAG: hypothetical protein H0V96_07835 [Acidimicrobiia bacterium]|nr:hypothetical protein [Acidimicrobiia bacterium]